MARKRAAAQTRADAADADHFYHPIDESEALEEGGHVGQQRLTIASEEFLDVEKPIVSRGGVIHDGWLVDESSPAADHLGHVVVCLLDRASLDALDIGAATFSNCIRTGTLENLANVDTRVPCVERRQPRDLEHSLAIGSRCVGRCDLGRGLRRVDIARGENEARTETLEVPLPRSAQRLVEVAHVENDVSLGCGECAEIRAVSVAGNLDENAALRRASEVERHQRRRAAIESERRRRHSKMADREE